ncbi:hypothetical protein PS15p_207596 [Mucor circinelloides]
MEIPVVDDANHSSFITNITQRALQSKDIARLYVVKELYANLSSVLANVLFLLLSSCYAGIAWGKMDEDMFSQTFLHPFLDVIFPVRRQLMKHGTSTSKTLASLLLRDF